MKIYLKAYLHITGGRTSMIKIALAGIAAVLAAMIFKNGKSEFGLLISLAACIFIFFYGIGRLELFYEVIKRIERYIGIDREYISILLKIVGITYISEFAGSLCKDAGYNAIAGQIEFAGKLSIMGVSIPILLALFDTIDSFFTL